MQAGITNILETCDDVERIALSIVDVVKAGGAWTAILTASLSLVKDIADLAAEAIGCWEEIKDGVEPQEGGKIVERLWQIGLNIAARVMARG